MSEVNWKALDTENDNQSGLVHTFELYAQGAWTGEDLVNAILEDFGPEELFHGDVKTSPSIYRSIKIFLAERGVNVYQHPSRPSSLYIEFTLYTGDELTKAEDLIHTHRAFYSLPNVIQTQE